MAEVVDIVHNLSYNVVGDQNLKDMVGEFVAQTKNVDLLKAKLAELNKAYSTETNVVAQQNLSGAILRVTSAIKEQSTALGNQVAQSKPLQQALVLELGIVQKLTDRLKDLRFERERAKTTGAIQEINAEIAAKQKELNSLLQIGSGLNSPVKEGGILHALIGGVTGGGAARQALNGILSGIGFGSGFGLITSVVTGLIDLGKSELDAVSKAEQLQAANAGLASSFNNLSTAIEKTNDVQQTLIEQDIKEKTGIDLTLLGYKQQEEAIKALGIVRGEAFHAEQAQFEQSQKTREIERQDLEKKLKDAIYIESVLSVAKQRLPNADNRTAAGAVIENIRTVFSSNTIDNRSRANEANDIIKASNLPRDIKDILFVAVKKAASENADILKVIEQQYEEYKSKRIKIENEISAKKNEIDNAAIARQSKINEEIYQLDLKLKKDLAAANERFAQDELKRQVTTASTIEKSIESETAFRLKQLAQEKELERKRFAEKGQSLPAVLENDFSQKATQIRQEQQAKRLEQTRAYYQQQVKLYEALQVELAAARLGSGKQRLSTLSALDESGNLSTQQDILDNELQIQLATNSAKYSNEVDTLEKLQKERRKRGEEETEAYKDTQQQLSDIYHEYAQNEEDLIRASNIRKLNEYANYYAKFIQLIKSNEASVLQAIGLRTSISGGDIRQDKGFNFLSKQDRLRINELRGANTANAQNTIIDNEALEKANKRSDIADANREKAEQSGKPDLITAAIKEQQAALDEVVRINDKIQKAQNNTFDNTKEIRKIYIEQAIADYQLMADSAVKAFEIISTARQKDLDREISVRQERIDLAFKLAERGNTVALAQEQKALEQAERQKRKAALVEQEVNAALVVSNALVAVAKSAAEGGILAPATIALTLAAIGIGFAEAQALSASQKTSFWKGGYTGEGGKYEEAGTVHKGEFVFTKEETAKHRELFEAIHKGHEPFPVMGLPKGVHVSQYAEKNELREISDKMDMLIGKDVNVSQVVDKSGVHQIVVEENKAHRNKWSP